MRARRVAVLLAAVLLAPACDKGTPHAAPATTAAVTTPTPTAPAPPADPDARRLRAAVQRVRDACPCRVAVYVTDSLHLDNYVRLTGTYDAAAQVTVLREGRGEARIVHGVTYLTADRTKTPTRWIRLDYARLPKAATKVTPEMMSALLDPSLAFAVASTIETAYRDVTKAKGEVPWLVSYDTKSGAAAAPAWSRGMLARMLGTYPIKAYVTLDTQGRLKRIGYATLGPRGSDKDPLYVWVDVLAVHVAAPKVSAPYAPVVDAAKA